MLYFSECGPCMLSASTPQTSASNASSVEAKFKHFSDCLLNAEESGLQDSMTREWRKIMTVF